ncbi:MAG: hypothetical protein IPP73_20010 [Chitinophagaceae bacterium]|nr:hypothetical protein [Chitinophagaceae bacterium]
MFILITRTWTVTDACGNIGTTTQTITFTRDTQVPVITVTPSSPVGCNPAAAAITTAFGTASVTDNCSTGLTATFTDGPEVGSGCSFSVTRTWTVTDACGNIGTASQTITFTRDAQAPVITVTPSSLVGCNPTAAAITAAFGTASVTDNCSTGLTATFTDGPEVGSGCSFSVTRTWTVTDACGNVGTAIQTITFTRDTQAPMISGIGADTTINCTASPVFPTAIVTDLCDASPVVVFSDVTTPGTCPGTFIITRTWTATDACGNISTAAKTITVSDNQPPVIVCPPAQVFCPSPLNTYTIPLLTVSDACSGVMTVLYTITGATTGGGTGVNASGVYNIGVSTINWQVTDSCGNTATCSTLVTINSLIHDTTNVSVCANQLPYVWHGTPYNSAGTYNITLVSTTGGCDTLATLNLSINPLFTSTTNATVCANQLPYIWHGNPYSLAGTYVDTLLSTTGGCDTVATLNLAITPLFTSTTNATVCANQLPYIWHGNPYGSAGTYIDTLLSTTGGCDTVATLNLTINPLFTSTTNATVCANQLPYIWHGNPYSLAGTYVDTLFSTTGGCDTVATLNLTINPLFTSTTNATVCANQLPYIWHGNPYGSAGTYVDTLLSTTGGCDTVATLNLTISPLFTSTTNATVCANQLPYIWHGNLYSLAGTYIDTLLSTTGGCDTVATLNLAITPLFTSTTNATVCANLLPYIWNGSPYGTSRYIC